jgi:hypothetical protein
MKKTLLALAAIIIVSILMGSHSARVQNDLILPFAFGAAAGYLNVDDGRSHPFDGTNTVNKFGRNADVDQAEVSIWDADELPTTGAGPDSCFTIIGTTADGMFVSSDDATDAGLEISIEVLDANWDLSVITMDLGVAAATTGTVYTQIGSADLLRINRAFATDDDFTGNIYMHIDEADGDTNGVPDSPSTQTIAVITAGENQTLQACYTVPNGFNALLDQWTVSNLANAANNIVTFRLRKSVEGGAFRTTELLSLANGAAFQDDHDVPVLFTKKTDIQLTAISANVNAAVTGTFDIVLLPE